MDLPKGIMNEEEFREQAVENINNCILCGTSLNFRYVTNFREWEVQEEGHCPICNIRNKIEKHKLH